MSKYSLSLIIASCILFLSFSTNPPQGNSGAPFDRTCARSGCHIGSGGDGHVLLEGIPTNIEPGKKYPFKIILEVTSGSPDRGGFQMVATDENGNDVGVLESPGSSSTTSSFQGRTYFEHQPAKNFLGDRMEYTAEWTAPESGNVTFYISAILADGNGSRSGDTYLSSEVDFKVMEVHSFTAEVTNISDVSCHGNSDGSASVEASGGSGSFSYEWDNGQMGQEVNSLSVGVHNVTVSDDNTVEILEFNISEPSPIFIGFSSTIALECADGIGNLTASITGGIEPYDIEWSTGSTESTIQNIGPGQYSLTVKDANGCIAIRDTSLFALDLEPPNISASMNIVASLGEGQSLLAVESIEGLGLIITDNCDENVSVDFNPKEFDCDDIGDQDLLITATDLSGNTASVNVTVEVKDVFTPSISCQLDTLRIASCISFAYSRPTAMDNCDNIRLELISGVGNNGSFPQGVTNDVYLATDLSGNTAMCEVVVLNEPQIFVEATINQISCFGRADGSIELNVTGSNPPFSTSIFELERTDNLSSGHYSYVVTDLTGCTLEGSFEIIEPKDLSVNEVNFIRPTNSNSGDGAIDIMVLGGTPPYSYAWMLEDDFFSDDENLTQLFPGFYSVEVTDSMGCMVISETIILEEVTSINDPIISEKVTHYPNPVDQILNLEIESLTFSEGQIYLYSSDGQLVVTQNANSKNRLNTSFIQNGVYILKLRMDDELVVRTIVVQH